MTVDIETVLVPIDGTEKSSQAVEYAVGVADRYGASVHALHVLETNHREQYRQKEVDPATVAERQQAFLDEATAGTPDVPVSASVAVGFSASKLTTNPVNVVLDTAGAIGADFIVIPRESVREEPTAMLAKVAQHVLSYANQPVLSV
jgi:nucleotide-binding universal stress UspA family protein